MPVGSYTTRERRQIVNERKGKVVAGEAGGNAWYPVVSIDRAGNQYVSIKGEGKCSTSVGVTPVVAITSNDKLPEGVNQHFVQCFDVFDARLWQVALFPLHLLFFGLRLGFIFQGIAIKKVPPIYQYHMGSYAMCPKRWRVMFILNQVLSDQLQ